MPQDLLKPFRHNFLPFSTFFLSEAHLRGFSHWGFKIHFVIYYSYKHDESSRKCYHLRWSTRHIYAFEKSWMGEYLLNINKVMIFQFQDIAIFEMAYHEKMEKLGI